MEEVLLQKENSQEEMLALETMCLSYLRLEDEVETMNGNTDTPTNSMIMSLDTCEKSPNGHSSENEIKILKTESYAEEGSNTFVSTTTVENSGNWTMSQVQAQNQSHEIGCSFPWSDVVSDTQRLNNDLLSLLDGNIGLFPGSTGSNTSTQENSIKEETEVKNLGPDLDNCSQSASEASTTDSNCQLTDDGQTQGFGEVYNYVYLIPSYAQTTSTSTVTKTSQAIPVTLPQTKVECLETGCSTPCSSTQLYPVPTFALPISEAITTEQLEKKKKVIKRKEKNRECSRQFRIKKKRQLQALKEGKLQKEKLLHALHRSIDIKARNLQKICNLGCAKSREILQSIQAEENKENMKENINPK